MTYIYVIRENTNHCYDYKLYVRMKEKDFEKREYLGGFLRFIGEPYDYAKNYGPDAEINGQKILSLSEFDEWRKEHHCC